MFEAKQAGKKKTWNCEICAVNESNLCVVLGGVFIFSTTERYLENAKSGLKKKKNTNVLQDILDTTAGRQNSRMLVDYACWKCEIFHEGESASAQTRGVGCV